tara:strand:+ start:173090 stop:175015 length:1926 start_codon:yes stop_codon:yes gene_type:complete
LHEVNQLLSEVKSVSVPQGILELGQGDLSIDIAESELSENGLIKARRFLDIFRDVYFKITVSEQSQESGILRLMSQLSLPTNAVSHEHESSATSGHHFNWVECLEKTSLNAKRKLLRGEGYDDWSSCISADIPSSIAIGIERLVREYCELLRDSSSMTEVVDLYESFAAVGEFLKDVPPSSGYESVVPMIERYAEALQSSLSDRVSIATASRTLHEKHLHLRGGLTKFMGAFDAVMKSSLGLYRRAYCDVNEANPERFGGICSTAFQQPIESMNAKRFSGKEANRRSSHLLLNVRLDLEHLLNPERVLVFFHEVGHAIFEAQFAADEVEFADFFQRKFAEVDSKLEDARPFSHECYHRSMEIYAELLVHALVFGSDTNLYCRYWVATLRKLSQTKERKRVRGDEILEKLYQIFMVCNAVEFRSSGGDDLRLRCKSPRRFRNGLANDEIVHLMLCRFASFTRWALTALLPSNTSIFPEESLSDRRTSEFFVERYKHDSYLAELFLDTALDAVSLARAPVEQFEQGGYTEQRVKLHSEVSNAIRDGRFFSRKEFAIGASGRPLDALDTISVLLYEYLRCQYGQDRSVIGAKNSQPYYKNGGSAVVPSVPFATRFKSQIAVYKTLWDVASHMKARRAEKLLNGG